MSGTSPYDVLSWAPVILPVLGVVGAIPTGREIIYIKHSPFGMLHIEIVATIPTTCRDGGEKDIQPKSAISARFVGRDARIFVSAMEHSTDTTHFDTIIILRGRDVFGGTVAVGLKDGCLVGKKFLTSLDYIYAKPPTVAWSTWRGRTVRLYRASDGIRRVRPTKGMKLEVRCGAGQYGIVPPSIISDLFTYNWITKPGLILIPQLPSNALERIYNSIDVQSHEEPIIHQLSDLTELWHGVADGARNHTSAILAGHLLCRNMPIDTVIEIMSMWNERNQPPLSERQLLQTIRSINVAELRKRLIPGNSLSMEIREWLDLFKGEFNIAELYRDLHLVTTSDRVNACQSLNRLVKEGSLCKSGRKRGNYRRLEDSLVPIDYESA